MSIQFFRKRREFGQPVTFSDADSVELWNSAQMECRPFKEKTPSVYFLEADAAVQAVPETTSIEIQATPVPCPCQRNTSRGRYLRRRSASTLLTTVRWRRFCVGSIHRCARRCSRMNECYDIFKDDFASLADDDAGPGAGAETMVETHSFTSLAHCKGKKVTCVDWVPGMKGCVAVSCAEQQSFEERVATGGQARHGAVLVWHFADPIHPQMVLEAPVDVHSFAFNPVNSALVAGGLANGQVCYWDVSELRAELARKKPRARTGTAQSRCPRANPRTCPEIPDSHVLPVTDVRWMGSDCRGDETQRRVVAVARAQDRGVQLLRVHRGGRQGAVLGYRRETRLEEARVSVHPDAQDQPQPRGARGDAAGGAIQLQSGSQTGWIDGLLCDVDGRRGAQCNFVKPEGEAHPEHTKLSCMAHPGPARSIDRSPFFPDVLLSVGDWTFKLWKEGEKNPIFTSPSADG